MNQREAVIEVMRRNGGFATLGFLYREVLRVEGVEWKTKTPFSSINRIVQDPKYFFRIRPGLWALLEQKNQLPADLRATVKPENTHTYYQGLLVQLGNMRGKKTFVPKQDRSRSFLGKRLGDLITADEIYPFTHDKVVRKATTVDVIWFDDQQMPTDFIEVENTTDMNGALLKFAQFYGFYSTFRIVADKTRRADFDSKVKQHVFKTILDRTKFATYDMVSEWHAKTSEIIALDQQWSEK